MKVALAWIVVTTITLGWVQLTRQAKVSRSLRNSLIIAARLFVVHALTYAVLCVWLGVSAYAILIISTFVLLLAPVATFDVAPPLDEVGFAIGIIVLLPVYALKQFILGFPDRDEVILTPPTDTVAPTDLSRLNEAIGTVVATLKPFGKVEIEGEVYSATTANGLLLDQDATVRVSGVRNAVLVVWAVEPLKEQQV